MKRITRFLSIFGLTLLAFSCSFPKSSGRVSLMLPFCGSEKRAADDDVTIYNFDIDLKDSTNHVQKKSAKSGDVITFDEVSLGHAIITVIASDEESTPLYSGTTEFEVVEGNNQVSVTLKKIEMEGDDPNKEPDDGEKSLTIEINGNAYTFYATPEDFNIDFFGNVLKQVRRNIEFPEAPVYKQLVLFDKENTRFDYTTPDTVKTFLANAGKKNVFTAKIGVNLSNYSDFIKSDEVCVGDSIYFIPDDSTTEIPYVDTRRENAKSLTLDFSDCENITKINSNAYTGNVSWVDNLYLPKTIQYIRGIAKVSRVVDILFAGQQIQFEENSTNTTDANVTYSIKFHGTAADWCKNVSVDSYTNNPLMSADGFIIKNTDYEFVDVYSENTPDFEIGAYCSLPGGGAGLLTEIPSYLFRKLKCKGTITIPRGVKTIGEFAFTYAQAKTVIIDGTDENLTIGTEAFSNMQNLTDVYITRTTVPISISADVFQNCGQEIKVHVPESVESDYLELYSKVPNMQIVGN